MYRNPPPRIHGPLSSTFVQPPFDSSLSFPALYDWQSENSRDHPLFVFEDCPGTNKTVTIGEANKAIHRATQYIRETVGREKKPFIAVLATSGHCNYACLFRY